jgi:hypothetical protein
MLKKKVEELEVTVRDLKSKNIESINISNALTLIYRVS